MGLSIRDQTGAQKGDKAFVRRPVSGLVRRSTSTTATPFSVLIGGSDEHTAKIQWFTSAPGKSTISMVVMTDFIAHGDTLAAFVLCGSLVYCVNAGSMENKYLRQWQLWRRGDAARRHTSSGASKRCCCMQSRTNLSHSVFQLHSCCTTAQTAQSSKIANGGINQQSDQPGDQPDFQS